MKRKKNGNKNKNRFQKISWCLAAGMAVFYLLLPQSALAENTGADKQDTSKEGKTKSDSQKTIFGIGSVSKVYTTAAIMKLKEEGMINLDQPVTAYLPGFTMQDERYRQITVRMLLDHTSGLQGSHYADSMTLGGESTKNHDTLLKELKYQRLKDDPGAFAVYCNDGFTLAELIIEEVSGKSFTQYIKDTFQQPLDLSVLETGQSDFDRTLLSPHYLNSVRKLPYEYANLLGSGGIYSTAEDVADFFQIFTQAAYQKDQPILSEESVMEMGEAAYQKGAFPKVDELGSSVAYGLGFDTVEEYPWKAFGIKAMSKGGDTTAYHAGVTVLPGQNISCAVLSTGGSSNVAGLAVQKIITEYLEEEGLLSNKQKDYLQLATQQEQTAVQIPDEIKEKQGWYATGSALIEVSFRNEFQIEIRSTKDGRKVIQAGDYAGDGSFVLQKPGYLSLSGSLVFAEAAVNGTTEVSFVDSGEKTYLVADTTEYRPGLGSSRSKLPMAEKIKENKLPEDVKMRWQEWSEKDYLLVSENYKSANYVDNPMVGYYMNEIEGYLSGKGMLRTAAKITDIQRADFFQQIPGHAGRDLVSVTLEEEKGRYLNTQNYRFLSEDEVTQIEQKDESVVMKENQETIWYKIPEDNLSASVTITAPSNGRFFIYKKEKEKLICIASSVILDSGTLLNLPSGGLIAFAGEAGASFSLDWE